MDGQASQLRIIYYLIHAVKITGRLQSKVITRIKISTIRSSKFRSSLRAVYVFFYKIAGDPLFYSSLKRSQFKKCFSQCLSLHRNGFLQENMQEQLLIQNIALTSMKYNSLNKPMKPKKFKQGFQTKENGLKEQEFVEFFRIHPEFC